MNNIFVVISLFAFCNSFACEFSSSGPLNLAVSTTGPVVFSYGATLTREQIPFFNVKNCQPTSAKNKYLMIAMGPEVVELSDKIRGTNFNRQYVDSKCHISNNPLKIITNNADQRKVFEKKWKYINECVEIQLTEEGARPLSFPAEQEGCKIKTLSPQSVSFNGGYCFFKPKADSNIRVELKISEACQKLEGYKELGVNLQDISGSISFYTSSEYKGDLVDLEAIGTSALRVSTNPVLPILKPGDDFGVLRPLFPENYQINDLHLGKIEFNYLGDQYLQLSTPIITSNFCDEVEVGGIKSSTCDYATPIVAEYFLKNDKNETLLNWYDGGIAPAQWQGIVNGEGYQTEKDLIVGGKDYQLEVYFSDPYFDFNYFKQRIRPKFTYTKPTIPVLNSDGSIAELPDYGAIENKDGIPTIEPIENTNFKKWLSNVKDNQKIFESYFSTSMFPPMYSQVCLGTKDNCKKIKKYFAKFTARFRINPDFSLSNLKIKRESTILEPYEKDVSNQPEYQCN